MRRTPCSETGSGDADDHVPNMSLLFDHGARDRYLRG
jgi:hypothetical protein